MCLCGLDPGRGPDGGFWWELCSSRLMTCKTVQATPQVGRNISLESSSSSQGALALNGVSRSGMEVNGSVAGKSRGDSNELERLFSGPSHCGDLADSSRMVSRGPDTKSTEIKSKEFNLSKSRMMQWARFTLDWPFSILPY